MKTSYVLNEEKIFGECKLTDLDEHDLNTEIEQLSSCETN